MTVALLQYPELASCDLSSLTAILSGAAPAPVWLWQKVRAEALQLGLITRVAPGWKPSCLRKPARWPSCPAPRTPGRA
jgi:hypothetical protein